MADYNAYLGDVEPEILVDPVEYVFRWEEAARMGVAVGYLLLYVTTILLFAACVITDRYVTNFILICPLIAAGVVSLLTTLWVASHARKKRIVVNACGIIVFKAGIVIQRCKWPEMTLIKQRFGQSVLADQQGKQFPFNGLKSISHDRKLALQVMLTKKRQLKKTLPRAPLKSILYWIAVGAVGVVAMKILPNYGLKFIDAIGDPSTSVLYRTQLLLLLILREIPVMGTLGFVIAFFYALEIWTEWVKKKNPFAQFVASKKGKLDSIEIVDSVWYRYFDQKAISKDDPLLALAIMIIPVLFFLIGPLAIAPRTSDGAILSLCCLPILILCTFGMNHLLKVRRTYFAQLRSVDGRFEIKLKEGNILSAEKLEKLKVYNQHRTTLGSVRWLLKASDGKQYVFDPRYLVPVEQGEEESLPQDLQPVL